MFVKPGRFLSFFKKSKLPLRYSFSIFFFRQWETLIKSYTGEDPLDNYYRYISWIEQTYPKHGHEGNLIPLLEHCLSLFENDQRYINERRFCKLWIKYVRSKYLNMSIFHYIGFLFRSTYNKIPLNCIT